MGNIHSFAQDLQAVYDAAGAAPHVVMTAAGGGVTFRDNATPLGGNLFAVQTNTTANLAAVTASTATFGVDVLPSGSRDLGQVSNRWSLMAANVGVMLNQAGTGAKTVTLPAVGTHGGILAGSQNGSGPCAHVLNNGAFPAVACIGNAAAQGAGIATMRASGGGSTAIGSAYAYGATPATVESTGFAATAIGYAYGSGTSRLAASGSGALAFGYANGRSAGSTANILSSSGGGFAAGLSRTQAGSGTALIQASGNGSFSQGQCNSVQNLNCTIQASGNGAFAQGSAETGIAGVPADVTASGDGAFAQGRALNTTIAATGGNSVQFGPGTNAQANSLQVGGSLRFKGTTGAFSSTADGDFYLSGGVLNFRSNGALHVFNTPSVTGSRAGNAALASLLTQLAAVGLIVDNSVV